MRIFITGSSGYVGEMLIERLIGREDVEEIIGLDVTDTKDELKQNKKYTFILGNMADATWQDAVAKHNPDVVIHTAWWIRDWYFNRKEHYRWNVVGSERVFDFVFSHPSVKKLIYFSTVSSYGALKENKADALFTEDMPFRKVPYNYAEEKRFVEIALEKKFNEAKEKSGDRVPRVAILRPAAITGPRGRYLRNRFGLQSALAGNLEGGIAYKLVTLLTAVVPATKTWFRQFIHEDDVQGIIERITFGDYQHEYEAFNIAPPGNIVTAKDMAISVKKKVFYLHPYVIRLAFFFTWNLSFGKIPTSRGSWKFYSYPLIVDGTKITKLLGYNYITDSYHAFKDTAGYYEQFLPESIRNK